MCAPYAVGMLSGAVEFGRASCGPRRPVIRALSRCAAMHSMIVSAEMVAFAPVASGPVNGLIQYSSSALRCRCFPINPNAVHVIGLKVLHR